MVHKKEYRITADNLVAGDTQVYDLFELSTYKDRLTLDVSNESKTNFFTVSPNNYLFDPQSRQASLPTAQVQGYLNSIGEEAILLIFDSSLPVDLVPALEGDSITPDKLTEEFLKRDLQDLRAPAVDRIPPNSVDTQHLAEGAVDADAIADGTIESRHIKEDAITGDKIKKGTVFEVEGLIDGSQISTGAVKNRHIPDGTLTMDKIDPEALKLAPSEDFFSSPKPGIVSSKKIADNAITSDKIAPEAIASQHIKPGSIRSENIAPGSVSGHHIREGSIGVESLDQDAILGAKIAPQSVTAENVVNNSLRREDFEEGTFNDGEPLVRDPYLRSLDLIVSNDPEDTDNYVEPLKAVYTYRDECGQLRPGKLSQQGLNLQIKDPINERYDVEINPLEIRVASDFVYKARSGLRRLVNDSATGRGAVPAEAVTTGVAIPAGVVPLTDKNSEPRMVQMDRLSDGSLIVAYTRKGKCIISSKYSGLIPKEKDTYDADLEVDLIDGDRLLFEYVHVDETVSSAQDFLDAPFYECLVIEKRNAADNSQVDNFLMFPLEVPNTFYQGTNMSTGLQRVHLTHTGGSGPLRTPLSYELKDGEPVFKDRIGLFHPSVFNLRQNPPLQINRLQVEEMPTGLVVGLSIMQSSFGREANLCLALVIEKSTFAFKEAPGTTGEDFDKYVWVGGQGKALNLHRSGRRVLINYAYNPQLDMALNHGGLAIFERETADDKLLPRYANSAKTKYYPGLTRQNTGTFFDDWSYMYQHTRVERLAVMPDLTLTRVIKHDYSPVTRPLLNCAYSENFFDKKDPDLVAKDESVRVPDNNPSHPLNLNNVIGTNTAVMLSGKHMSVNSPFSFTYFNDGSESNEYRGRATGAGNVGLTYEAGQTPPLPAGSNVDVSLTDNSSQQGITLRYTRDTAPPFDTLTGGVYIGDSLIAEGDRVLKTSVNAVFDLGTEGFALFAQPIWRPLKSTPTAFSQLSVKVFELNPLAASGQGHYINRSNKMCRVSDNFNEIALAEGRGIEVDLNCAISGIEEEPLGTVSNGLNFNVTKKLSEGQSNVSDISTLPTSKRGETTLSFTWKFGNTTTYVSGLESNVTTTDLKHFFHGILRSDTEMAVVPGSIVEGYKDLVPGARYSVDQDGEWFRTGGDPIGVALSPTEMRIATPACSGVVDYQVHPPTVIERPVVAETPIVEPPPTPTQRDPMTVWIGWREDMLTSTDAASAEFETEYKGFESIANIRTNSYTFTLPQGTNDKHLVIVMTDENKKLTATKIFLGGSFINQEAGFNKILDTAALNVYQSNNKLLTSVFGGTDIQVTIRREDP